MNDEEPACAHEGHAHQRVPRPRHGRNWAGPWRRTPGRLAGTALVRFYQLTLSGFVGKLLILDALTVRPGWPWLWALVLGGSLMALVGFGRAGSLVFWKCLADPGEPEPDRPRHDTVGIVATSALVAAPVLLALFAGPAMSAMEATALQLFTPERYIEAVLGSGVRVAEAMP